MSNVICEHCGFQEMNSRMKKTIKKLKNQVSLAREAIDAVLDDEFALEHADIELIAYLMLVSHKLKSRRK